MKGKYGQCWRSFDGIKRKPEHPNDYYNRCDGREDACPKAEAQSLEGAVEKLGVNLQEWVVEVKQKK